MIKKFYSINLIGLFVAGFSTIVGYTQTTVYNVTGGIETYTVPAGVTSIQIETFGAQGGNGSAGTGGNGAEMKGEFTVVPGQVLNIMVGDQPNAGNGGGGGTFVVDLVSGNPLIVAGGGGGGAGSCCGVVHNGEIGVITTNGTAGINASGGTGAGGVGGNGGDLGTNGQCGGAGGGFFTNGANGYGGSTGGQSYLNGGAPGTYEGGYGGGGGSHCGGPECAGGGGGGYSGGGSTGGGGQWGGGGGGGSYNAGTNQVNVDGGNSGDGQVIITVLCQALTTSVSTTTLCSNDFLTLSATSINGGTVSWNLGVVDNVAFQPDTVGTITYIASSTDPADCAFNVDVVVLSIPEFTLSTTDEFGGLDGGIYVTLIDGIFPFIYDWDNDGTGDFDDTQNLTNIGPGTYTLVIEQGNGCTATQTATVNSQLGMDENLSTISVYPNPTTDNITITFEGSFYYQVTDVLGKVVSTGNGMGSEVVSMSTLAHGTYLLMVSSGNITRTIQVIKQ